MNEKSNLITYIDETKMNLNTKSESLLKDSISINRAKFFIEYLLRYYLYHCFYPIHFCVFCTISELIRNFFKILS